MSDDPTANTPKRLRPTVIAAPAKRAKTVAAAPDAPRVSAPTVVPGTSRKRIAVRSADMALLCPGVAPRTAAQAVRCVDSFVAEDARDQRIAAWGRAAQKRGAALLETPVLPQAEVPGQVRGYIGRIVTLLAAIDIDKPRTIAAARAELEKLVRLTEASLAPLQALTTALDDRALQIERASLEIEAAALAALFLSEHLGPSRPELSRRFLQREMSLTKTALEIRAGQFERDSQREEPRALFIAVQDVVLVSLPDCLAALGRAGRRLNPTEAGELQQRLRTLLRKLDA